MRRRPTGTFLSFESVTPGQVRVGPVPATSQRWPLPSTQSGKKYKYRNIFTEHFFVISEQLWLAQAKHRNQGRMVSE